MTLSLHRPARPRWGRAVIPLGIPHQPRRRLSRLNPGAEPFARDDNDDQVELRPVRCVRLDPDDMGYFFGIYRHGDPRQSIHDLCGGKEALKGANWQDVARETQRRADDKDGGSTKPEVLPPWDALGFGTEAWAASEQTFWHTIFETACWSQATVDEARSKYMEDEQGWINGSQTTNCQLPDYLASIQRRSEFMVAAGALYASCVAKQWLNSTQDEQTDIAHLGRATAKSLGLSMEDSKRNENASRLTLIAQCLAKRPPTSAIGQSSQLSLQSLADDVRRATKYCLLSGLPYRPKLGLLYNDMLNEATALIRYDLEHSLDGNPLNSPATCTSSKSGESAIFSPFQVTDESSYSLVSEYAAAEAEHNKEEEEGPAARAVVLDLPLFSGYSASRSVVQDIAAGLQADVVHITPSSIARLLECPLPLTRNGTQFPTDPISKLRFRVAEKSGWLNSAAESMQKPKYRNARALNRRYRNSIAMMMQDEPDSEELGHIDALKVDVGLNLIRETKNSEAQDPSHSLRPTLIHIHDFNALCMDENNVVEKILL